MRIINKLETPENILVGSLTDGHVVVGLIHGDPVMLIETKFESGKYAFRIMSGLTRANGYSLGEFGTSDEYGFSSIEEAVLFYPDARFEAFTQWQDAMRWLLANDPTKD